MPPVTGFRRRARATADRPFVGRGGDSPVAATLPPVGVAGIALGVALLLSSMAVASGVDRAVERTVGAALGRADFTVSASDGSLLSDETLATVESVFGIAVAAPSLARVASLIPEGDAPARPDSPATLIGIDPLLDSEVRAIELVAGAGLTRRDEAGAIISERLATEDGYGLGSDLVVATPGEPERFRVVGIAAGDGPPIGEPSAASAGRTVVLPIDAVARMFGLRGATRVDLLVGDEIPRAGVEAELREALATEPVTVSSPLDLAGSYRSALGPIAGRAAAAAVLGVAFGALVIVAAAAIAARDVGPEVVGAARLRRAASIGAAGVGLGLALDFALAIAAGAVGVTAVGLGPAGAGVVAIVAAAALGVGATVVAALRPAWRAGLDRRRTRDGLATLALGLGGVVAVATLGANARRVAAQSLESLPGDLVRGATGLVDGLALVAAVVAAAALYGALAGPRRNVAEAARAGLAGAALGSVAGLAAGAILILVAGGPLHGPQDIPWLAIAIVAVLGVVVAGAAAAFPVPPRLVRPALRPVRLD